MLEELKEANSYISSKIDKYRSRSLLIKEIEEDAEINNVPIISKEIREYLKFSRNWNGYCLFRNYYGWRNPR